MNTVNTEYSISDAAKLIKSSRSQIYGMIARGQLEQVIYGKRRFITAHSLHRWIELKHLRASITKEMNKQFYTKN